MAPDRALVSEETAAAPVRNAWMVDEAFVAWHDAFMESMEPRWSTLNLTDSDLLYAAWTSQQEKVDRLQSSERQLKLLALRVAQLVIQASRWDALGAERFLIAGKINDLLRNLAAEADELEAVLNGHSPAHELEAGDRG